MEVDARAWLVSAVGEVRTYGGHDGYVDDPEATYRWDSNVANYRGPRLGDYIVVRDKKESIGYSVIETVTECPGEKTIKYCPSCDNSEINPRKTLGDYLCSRSSCKNRVFKVPKSKIVPVTEFEAWYAVSFVPLDGVFTARELLDMCPSKGRESIRTISWASFSDAVAQRTGAPPKKAVSDRHDEIAGGHKLVTVRVRNGQAAFRKRLVAIYGNVCAFTGPCAPEALDAAHLYSFAKDSKHHEFGGVLLRKDIHSLFDRGLIAVHPETYLIKPKGLDEYPQYADLMDAPLHVALKPKQLAWLQLHWLQYRT